MKGKLTDNINIRNEAIVVKKLSPIDENDFKQNENFNSTFTNNANKIDAPKSVSFFKLYRFANGFDKCLLFIGFISVIITATCIPFQMDFYGTLTNDMVTYGIKRQYWDNLTDEQKQQANNEFFDSIHTFAIEYGVIGIITIVGSYISICCYNYSASRQIYVIRGLFFKKTLEQDITWFDVNDSGEFASRMAEDLDKLEEGIGEKVVMFIQHQIVFIGCYIQALTKGWELALICMISMPITTILMGSVTQVIKRYAQKEMEEYAKAGSIAEEVLSSIRTVIAFGGETKEVQRYSERLNDAKVNNIRKSLFMGIGFGCLWFVIYASQAFSFWYGIGLVLRDRDPINPGHYSIHIMITVFFSVMMGNMNFGMSTPFIANFAVACGAAAKVYSIIDSTSKINAMSTDGLKPAKIFGSIQFKNIHFQYPSRADVKVLQGLNLTINRGETVALVGKSGCGKSTCIQLIQRFYDPQTGTVELDGENIKNLNVAWLRSQIGVVGQEPVLFSQTIADNIRYGNLTATQDDIENAAKKANAHDFILGLPKGYNTVVGERGTQMSGGQKQRIAIARALVRNPAILLLDEATSALDTNSEAKVQVALDKASKGRTTIIVAHRLSTIRGADKIAVISDGQVVEQGTHNELMNIKGHYFNLVTAQVGVDENQIDIDNKPVASRQISKISVISSGSRSSDSSIKEQLITDLDDVDTDADPPSVSMLNILSYNSPEWKLILIACIGSALVGTSMPLFSVIFGDILGDLSGTDEDSVRKTTNFSALLLVILGVFVGVSVFFQQYLFGIAGEKLTMRLRHLLFEAMLRQEIGWFDDPKQGTGTLCARLSIEAAAVQGATGQRIGNILQAITTIIFAVGLSMYYEWRLGLVALAFTPFILIGMYFERAAMMRQNKTTKKDIEQSAKLAVEAVSNIRTVVSLGREQYFYEEYIVLLIPSLMQSKRSVHSRGIVFGSGRSIMYFAYAVCMLYGSHLIVYNNLDYSKVFKVSQALIMGTSSIAQAFAFAPNFQKGMDAAANIFHLLKRQPKVQSASNVNDTDWNCNGDIEYKDVSFQYPTRPDTQILRKLHLSIECGKTVALVGPSGCGKSTIVQLLERFYDPNDGFISIDNKLIKNDITLGMLRSKLGIVSQEPVLFDRSIEENIAYGDNSKIIQRADIIEAAKQANIHNFIASLPLGYGTKLGDKGTQLSGGQKQRVAIARALVRNPKILLLDEATSALDTESEQIVQDALDKAREGRTCITIAHRLTTIQDADLIFVINKGRIVEMGTHQHLLLSKGMYYKLQQLQGRKN